jgi:hypothetical protein
MTAQERGIRKEARGRIEQAAEVLQKSVGAKGEEKAGPARTANVASGESRRFESGRSDPISPGGPG